MTHYTLHVYSCLFVHVCVSVCVMASGQDSEGYRVWISRSAAGVRKRGRKLSNARCFHGNPLIWRDADAKGHRVTGGLPGRWVSSRK